jgi:hypothetical protein
VSATAFGSGGMKYWSKFFYLFFASASKKEER